MKNNRTKLILSITILLLASLFLVGCQTATTEAAVEQALVVEEQIPTEPPPQTATSPPPTATTEPSPTPIPPTDTPEPTATPLDIPEPRVDPAMAYDSESDRLIIFGGFSSVSCGSNSAKIDDSTWSLDLNTNKWTNMHPESGPTAITGGTMAYDAESDRAILFGGYDEKIDGVGDTWAYDINTNTWTQMAEGPSPRSGARMVYDSESDRIILFGGLTSHECADFENRENAYNDTWAYDYNNNTWTEITASESPPERYWHLMAYDAESDRTILLGGAIKGDMGEEKYVVWGYDYNTNTWEELGSVTMEAAYQYGAMDYDSESDKIVAHGMGETWIFNYNGNTWREAYIGTGKDIPAEGLNSFAIVYNPALDRMVVFGGCKDPYLVNIKYNDVWLFDLNGSTWEKMEVSP